uniref:Beta-Ig-H3/fasciclin n=1 Tax=Medicago truncatula TaxID=3880 RepID=A2Q4K4_MEDTR|nr:Beta-Ig-H3/fasciclin [Medicago truncatula]
MHKPFPYAPCINTSQPSDLIALSISDCTHAEAHRSSDADVILTLARRSDLATAAPSLSDAATTTSPAWTGPFTIFAPFDASLHTCFSCSVPNLLREHIVPGIFTIEYLRRLAFGTKIETLSPGRCVTITSESIHPNNTSGFVTSRKMVLEYNSQKPFPLKNGFGVQLTETISTAK